MLFIKLKVGIPNAALVWEGGDVQSRTLVGHLMAVLN